MLTNGDNMYNSAWFDVIAPVALEAATNLIGWDFVTHHPRGHEDTRETTISISLERGKVDLGSVMIRSQLYKSSGLKFLSDAIFTPTIFARDFVTIVSIASVLVKAGLESSIKLIHQVLMFHQ